MIPTMLSKHWRLAILAVALLATFASARCGNVRCDTRGLATTKSFEDVFWATAFPHHFATSGHRHGHRRQNHRQQPPRAHHRNYHEVVGGGSYTYSVHEDDDSITLNMVLPGYSSNMIDLELKTTTQFGEMQRSLTVSPNVKKGGKEKKAPAPFSPTVFSIDGRVDAGSITSTMKNGILEIVGKKIQPTVDKTSLPIIEEVSVEEEQDDHVEVKVEEPSPNDSPDVEIKTDED
mmetsp:Transcript_15165/g.28261  ORF Transcript_15165/g.28261 Transcript_15165/m.28261 type:complete len:233 (+) Transcript_15165:91-789(+)